MALLLVLALVILIVAVGGGVLVSHLLYWALVIAAVVFIWAIITGRRVP